MDVVIDGKHFSGEYLLVEVMNFGCAGPNLFLAPQAGEGDGLFDVVLADVTKRAELIQDLPSLRRRDRASSCLRIYRGRRVTLDSESYRLHLDDQLRDCHGRVELTVEPQALTFLV